MADKFTPLMYARGKYELKYPWVANASKVYTCIAIRSFEDIYTQGEDVFKVYYSSRVQEGQTINGSVFKFDDEAKKLPNIITLRSEDNEIIFVPDTFIISYPNTTLVPYSNVVLGVGLGPLPDELSLSGIQGLLKDNVLKYYGITTEIEIMRLPTTTNPTPEQHEQMEQNRLGAVTANVSIEEQLEIANRTIDEQRNYILQLELSLQAGN